MNGENGMSYKVDYGELDALLTGYNGAISAWNAGINSVAGKASAIQGSPNISGNSADRLRDYLDAAYSYASVSMSMLLERFQKQFLLYTEAYHQQVDASAETHIEEEELSDHASNLQTKRSQLQQIALSAETAVAKISDLVSVSSLDVSDVDAEFSAIKTALEDLDAAVNGVESAYSSGGIDEINELLTNSTAFIKELCQQGEDFKTSFSAASFAGLVSLPALVASLNKTDAWLTTNESAVATAAEHLEQRLALRQAEYEKRQKQAEVFKILTYAAVAIGSAVVIAAFPAASPVVIGMASGFLSSTLSAAADEYVEHGFNTSQWDKGRIGAHACIGTVTGIVGGAVGPEAGIFVKAGVKGLSGALEGAATTSYDQLSTYGRITDTKAILVDTAVKGGSSFAGSLAGGAIAKNVKTIGISSLDMARNDPLSSGHSFSVFLFEGGKSLGTGVIKRGVSGVTGQVIALSTDGVPSNLGDIDLGAVREDMFSLKSMGQDFAVSGATGAASDYVSLRTPDKDTGLTPIIQYKLGNTTDPETGLTPIVQDSLGHMTDQKGLDKILAEMEERNPSTGANAAFAEESAAQFADANGSSGVFGGTEGRYSSTGSVPLAEESPNAWDLQEQRDHSRFEDWNAIDWENTSSTPEELRQIEEMEQRGEFEIDGVDYSSVKVTSNFVEPQFPTMRTPTGNAGTWLGERGNSGYIPDNPAAQAVMREYGQDSVAIHNSHPDFSPFSVHDTPWGTRTCEVEIGHMVPQRAEADGNYKQADEELAKMIGGGVTRDDVRQYREQNKLTWHEVEDGKTMQLIPTVINSSVAHTGGVSISGYGQKMGDISHDYE